MYLATGFMNQKSNAIGHFQTERNNLKMLTNVKGKQGAIQLKFSMT
jgi:hypothetical protein